MKREGLLSDSQTCVPSSCSSYRFSLSLSFFLWSNKEQKEIQQKTHEENDIPFLLLLFLKRCNEEKLMSSLSFFSISSSSSSFSLISLDQPLDHPFLSVSVPTQSLVSTFLPLVFLSFLLKIPVVLHSLSTSSLLLPCILFFGVFVFPCLLFFCPNFKGYCDVQSTFPWTCFSFFLSPSHVSINWRMFRLISTDSFSCTSHVCFSPTPLPLLWIHFSLLPVSHSSQETMKEMKDDTERNSREQGMCLPFCFSFSLSLSLFLWSVEGRVGVGSKKFSARNSWTHDKTRNSKNRDKEHKEKRIVSRDIRDKKQDERLKTGNKIRRIKGSESWVSRLVPNPLRSLSKVFLCLVPLMSWLFDELFLPFSCIRCDSLFLKEMTSFSLLRKIDQMHSEMYKINFKY